MTEDYNFDAAKCVSKIHNYNINGDILVFLASLQDLDRVNEILEREFKSIYSDLNVLKLHGQLSAEEQNKVFNKSEKRKIILSTNVAETSLTIEGIK